MYQYSEIQALHIEISSRCNVSCPMCARNVSGGRVNPYLPVTELSLNDIQKALPADFISRLRRISFCGNHGDPVTAKELPSILRFLREINPDLFINLWTNGSLRSASYWRSLAKILSVVHFSIDGLADTNGIYRRGADFGKIMENAAAFIEAGGEAIWDFIVFRHNEHQVEEARALARKMGFQRLILKKTGRFFSNSRSQTKSRHPVLNRKGEREYFLEPPENPAYQNESLRLDMASSGEKLLAHLNQTTVRCQVQEEKSVYISAEGHVFPCCFLAGQMYLWHQKRRENQIYRFLDRLPEKEESLNIKKRSLKEILQDPFFQKTVPEAQKPGDVRKDRLFMCAKTCGKVFQPFQDQFQE